MICIRSLHYLVGVERSMFTFIDENGLNVDLRFDEGPFEVEPKHVLVLVWHEGAFGIPTNIEASAKSKSLALLLK